MSESISSLPMRYYSVDDYFNLPYQDEVKYELNDGWLAMSPSPGSRHQATFLQLAKQLDNYFEDKSCRVFQDLDVKLFDDEDLVYRPDVFVVCDKSKIYEQYIAGPPDFVIEVGSLSTIKRDMTVKKANYQRAGVKEYWVVHNPYLVYSYLLNNEGIYEEEIYRNQTEIAVKSFNQLSLSFVRLQKLLG